MMNKYAFLGLLALSAAACVTAAVSAAPDTDLAAASELEQKYNTKIDELLPGMGDPEIVKRKDSQQALEQMCHQAGTPGKETERAALCRAMMTKVEADVAKPARIWMLRKVEPLGRDEVVAALTRLLEDKDADIRETARRALVNNPSPRAGASLRAALAKADTPEWKIGMINGMAFRKDGQAVPAIVKLTADPDDAVANAAVCALGNIRTPEATEAITTLLKKPRPALQARVAEAAMKCAEDLTARNAVDQAVAIYEQLYDKSQPENIRIAGLQGIAAARGPKALPMLFELLDNGDPHMQMIAGRCIEAIPGDDVTRKLLAALSTAKPEAADLIIDVLGQRGPEAREAVAKLAAEATDPALKNAAVLALARFGDPTAVDLLWNVAKTTDNPSHRSVALRGYVRLISKQAKPTEKLQALASAMKLADQTEDRKLIVSAMGGVPDPKALEQIMPLVEGDLHTEAFAAAVSVAKRIAGRDQELARETVEKLSKAAVSDAEKAEVDKLLDAMNSYCVSWMVSGPYKERGKEGLDLLDVAFPPEEPAGNAKWKALDVTDPDQPGRFDLGKGNNCCAYVRTTVISDSERKVQLAFGSDDAIKVWLNGEVIHTNKVNRPCTCDQDKVEATLKKGANTLLLKIAQGGGDWAFCAAIRGTDGKPLAGLKFEAK